MVVSAEKKGVSSTTGMQTTVKTSTLFKTRAQDVVPQRMKEMEEAILLRDFETFAKVTMRESNSFHATCLDTDPPIFYLNDVSRAAIRAVEAVNQLAGRTVAAYTFDAGPNAVVYYLEREWAFLAERLDPCLCDKGGWVEMKNAGSEESRGLGAEYAPVEEALRKGVSRIILTSVGEGPISVQDHLVDEQGNPVHA